MTNVTFLPWVDPEQNSHGVSSGFPGETPQESMVPAGVQRLSTVMFTDVDDDVDPGEDASSVAALDLDALEQALLRKLNTSDMTVHEVMAWLRSRDAAEGDAAHLVEKFERLNYLNDERLAHELVTRLSERRGKSKSIIGRELRQRGISSTVLEIALSSLNDDDELHKATELALHRVRQFSKLDDATAERRLMGFLARRGFSGQIVREASRQALATRH